MHTLHLGNCLHILRNIPENSIDSVVCDPPYELGFMGKSWDASGIAYSVEMWKQALRVLKPGGHLLAFSGSRTYHRMTCAIEDAGFEVRDQMLWVYGSGFPKSLDVSKAIDKAAGVRRHDGHGFNAAGVGISNGGSRFRSDHPEYVKPSGITEAAKQWQGWGTALKPAHEPICVARKPLAKGLTVAANVLAHGTGALNIDGCRVGDEPPAARNAPKKIMRGGKFHAGAEAETEMSHYNPTQGRWPANLIHDGSDEVLALFPDSKGQLAGVGPKNGDKSSVHTYGDYGPRNDFPPRGDTGSAARFFYCAKTSKKDRNEGLDDLPCLEAGIGNIRPSGGFNESLGKGKVEPRANNHPTVKPTDLMRYLCRLVTPPGGTVLDPFMGSGSTGKAAMLEGFRFVGIEMDESYHTIAKARIEAAQISLFADMI